MELLNQLAMLDSWPSKCPDNTAQWLVCTIWVQNVPNWTFKFLDLFTLSIALGVSKNPQKYFANKSAELCPYNPANIEKKNPENLKNDQKMMAESDFDIDITNAHNPFDQETVQFLSRNVSV